MNPSWVNFYYVKPDLLIKLFEIIIEIELSGHITVLGAIALTVSFVNQPAAYKSATGTVNQEGV